MTRRKKITLIVIIILVMAVVAIGILQSSQKEPEYTTIMVERGELKQSVDATGKVESAEKIDLNFKTTGRIQEILVQAGDEVKAGQKLASLNARALESQVDDAQARLNQSLANYQKLLAGASAADILISENTAEQKFQDLLTAKNDLGNLKITRDTDLQNLRDTAVTNLNNEIINAQIALDEVEDTLSFDDAQSTLSVKDSGALIQAEANQIVAQNAVEVSQTEIALITNTVLDEQVLEAMDNLKLALNLISTTLTDTMDVVNATIISSSLSKTELDTLKANVSAQQTKINTSKTNIQTSKSNWTNDIVYYQDQINSYEDAVKNAEKNLEIAQAQLDLKKEPPRQFEIDAARAQVDQARAALNLAYANLEDTLIKSPLDGTVVKKNYEVGEQTSGVTPVLEMIGESTLQIEVDIPESDIAKVKTGQEVEITLDAFTDEDVFSGKVTFVDPAETIIQEVVYYRVKVQFDKAGETIKPGMTANVIICTNNKKNVLFVPARAIKTDNGDKYVQVLENGKPVDKQVTTGMRGNEGIEITSGLQAGEVVITFVKE